VLLKLVDTNGFTFFTNYSSQKALDIEANNQVSLHFPWHAMDRQVRITGVARKIPKTDSLKYFLSRPKDSQLAAWASEQSKPISSRQVLMTQFESVKRKFLGGQIPLPDFWGGINVVPNSIEFWQGSVNRLHDRFLYELDDSDTTWHIKRLAP
jgi:pyridoxamine 5'-phosphate oxidase